MASVQASLSDGISRIGNCCENDVFGKTEFSDIHENNNPGEDIIDDLDSYLEEINDRLTIWSMVSGIILEGILNDVSQEAAEIVAVKEHEIASLKEVVRGQQLGQSQLNFLTDISQQVGKTTFSSQEEWKVELYIRKEIETMVLCTIVQGLKGEYEEQLWDVSNVLELINRFNEISDLHLELNSIRKLFDCHDAVYVEMDHLHRKVSGNHSHLWNGNSTFEESKYTIPETLENSPLGHMNLAELYQYFRTVMNDMKRAHESAVQQMTEEYFALKRELLKERELVRERGTFAAFKKEKDFEIVKKRIIEAISKLDEILEGNEKLSEFCNHSRDKLDSLLSENFHLRELLNKQKLKAFNLNKLVEDLECALRDKSVESSISEDIYKCVIREMDKMINSSNEDLDFTSVIMEDILGTIYGEAYRAGFVSKSYHGDLDLRSSIEKEIYDLVLQQVVGDLSMAVNGWKEKCLKKDEHLGFLQSTISEIKSELTKKDEENEELRRHISMLENISEEKDKVLLEKTAFHEKERAQWTEEFNKLRDEESHKSNELVLMMHKLEHFELQIENLNSELKLSQDKLRKSDEEKTNFASDLNKNYLAVMRAKDDEHVKHMESLSHVVQGLSKSFADFELRIKESIGWQSVRLENSSFQLHSFIPKVNMIRRTSSLYKERLEKRCSDLQKAEAEVDLLGDEVDALLSLLDKIYIALDHYSPILQHYPGIIEILKLVKRELSKDSVKGHLAAT